MNNSRYNFATILFFIFYFIAITVKGYSTSTTGLTLTCRNCVKLAKVQRFNTALFAGFGKSNIKVEPKAVSVSPDTPCSCNSGKLYGECCKKFHDGAIISSPLELVRSRYSAFIFKSIPYLLASTHPDSKDFVADDTEEKIGSKRSKRTIWLKGLESFAADYEFSNLAINEESIITKDENNANVICTLERKYKTAMKPEICSESIFAKKDSNGSWLYFSGKTEIEGNSGKPKKVVVRQMN